MHERRDELQVLDVREDEEWTAGRIDGAMHIPLAQLPARLAELDRDPAGGDGLPQRGQSRPGALSTSPRPGCTAEVMDGGMTAWAEAGLPVTTPDGRPGRVA